ncbi:MAG: cell division protein ZapE [Pseudobdellovibrionaceae bacterium]
MTGTPLDRYHAMLSRKHIDPDPLQERAAQSLTRLHHDVLVYEEERKSWRQKLKFLGVAKLPPRGVYLHGPVGRGKSMLMDVFYDSIPLGIKKRRVHFHQFMIEVHDYIHSRRQNDGILEDMDAALPSLALVISNRSRVLCFDEFHVVDVADAMILSRLFAALFDQGISVVMTSNWAPDDLYRGGLQRERFLSFIKLVKERMEVVAIDSPTDYRARQLREMSVYFAPLNPDSYARANHLFEVLTEGVSAEPDLVNVKGRTIQVPESAKGVARFGFAQLCERPLGAEDYLAIAKRYHTVFVENVPHLGYDRRNEAKRLMTLVDVLYDHHRNLVITAEEMPQKLYTGHDHAFEFQRTVSRLLEMQGDAYLNQA